MNSSPIPRFSRSLEIFLSLLTFFCVSYGCKQGFYLYMIQIKRKKGGNQDLRRKTQCQCYIEACE